jgi:hypothetical protein
LEDSKISRYTNRSLSEEVYFRKEAVDGKPVSR